MVGSRLEEIEINRISHMNGMPIDLLLMADPSLESIEDYIYRGETYGAYINGKIIGVYVLMKTRPFTMELVNISVKENYQGKGVGKLLVKDSIQRAKEKGIKRLEVGTGNSSINQLALYQKCGFRIKGIDQDFFTRHYKEEIIENGIPCVDMIRLGIDFQH